MADVNGSNSNDTVTTTYKSDYVDQKTTQYADNIHMEGGDDTVYAGSGYDKIHGGPGNDKLHGEGDYDDIFGDKGVDQLWGGNGEDYFYFHNGDSGDVFVGEADTIQDFEDNTDKIFLKGDYEYVGNTAAPGNGQYGIWTLGSNWMVTFTYNDNYNDIVVTGGDPHGDILFF